MSDEAVNWLDPEGIVWIRTLLRGLAGEGRTILISSHLMTEIAMTADRVLVVGRGRLIADAPLDEFTARGGQCVAVRSARAAELADVVRAAGGVVSPAAGDAECFDVGGLDVRRLGDLALEHLLPVHGLAEQRSSLEDVSSELTDDSVDFHGAAA